MTEPTPTTAGHRAGTLEMPPLPATAILLVEVGSTAHGTGIEGGEDHDELGIVVEPSTLVLGLSDKGYKTVMQRTQPEGERSGPGDVDRTLYSLRRFLRLAASGNPSVLMSLWAPIEFASVEGEELRSLGDAFVGRHVIPRYRGYMRAQVAKVLETEAPEATYEAKTKSAMHAARLGIQGLELLRTGALELPMLNADGDWLRAVRRGEIPFDEWKSRTTDLDRELESLVGNDGLPAVADRVRIEHWSVATHRSIWNRTE